MPQKYSMFINMSYKQYIKAYIIYRIPCKNTFLYNGRNGSITPNIYKIIKLINIIYSFIFTIFIQIIIVILFKM